MSPLLFLLLATLLLAAALGVVAGRGRASSAVLSWLGMMVALSGLEVIADAPFVAAVQLAVALVSGLAWLVVAERTAAGGFPRVVGRGRSSTLPVVGGVIVAFALASLLSQRVFEGPDGLPPAPVEGAVGTPRVLGGLLFGPWWLALEVLGGCLFAAIVGAVALRVGED